MFILIYFKWRDTENQQFEFNGGHILETYPEEYLLPTKAYMGRLRQKRKPYLGFRYIKEWGLTG